MWLIASMNMHVCLEIAFVCERLSTGSTSMCFVLRCEEARVFEDCVS